MEEKRQPAWYSSAKPLDVHAKRSRERRVVNQREGAVIAQSAGWVVRLQQEKAKVAVRHPIEQTAKKSGIKLDVEFLVLQKTQVARKELIPEVVRSQVAYLVLNCSGRQLASHEDSPQRKKTKTTTPSKSPNIICVA
jgi:hypothetical protein